MGIIYLEHGVTLYNSDALSVHDNFIAECGNCVELRGAGQASKITDNLMGAGYRGYTIFAENFGGLLITSNNIFPRGKSIVHLKGVLRSSVTANRFHSFYPGMLIMEIVEKISYLPIIFSEIMNHGLRCWNMIMD